MYCPNCCLLDVDKKCPACGTKHLRMPASGDYCFLTEKELIWAAALEDLLQDNGIPFVTKNALGAGLAANLGSAMERKRFFVPYAHYTAARVLEEDFFSGEFEFDE